MKLLCCHLAQLPFQRPSPPGAASRHEDISSEQGTDHLPTHVMSPDEDKFPRSVIVLVSGSRCKISGGGFLALRTTLHLEVGLAIIDDSLEGLRAAR